MVNNAGIGYFAAVEETDPQTARRLLDVRFHGVARVIHAVLPGMRARRSGTLVNLTSIGGLVGDGTLGPLEPPEPAGCPVPLPAPSLNGDVPCPAPPLS